MKRRYVQVLVALSMVGLMACGGGGSSSGGSDSGDGGSNPVANVAGSWRGSWRSAVFPQRGTLRVTLTQSGDRLTGSLMVSGGDCIVSARVSGTVSGVNVVFGTVATGNSAALSFSGTSRSNQMSGNYRDVSGICEGDRGTWSVSK